jgi:hypothetical protein
MQHDVVFHLADGQSDEKVSRALQAGGMSATDAQEFIAEQPIESIEDVRDTIRREKLVLGLLGLVSGGLMALVGAARLLLEFLDSSGRDEPSWLNLLLFALGLTIAQAGLRTLILRTVDDVRWKFRRRRSRT